MEDSLPRVTDDPLEPVLGSWVRARRKAAGVSQQGLAARIGVSYQQVQKYESGESRIAASMLVRIAQVLSASMDDLLPGLGQGLELDADMLAFARDGRTAPMARGWARLTEAQRADISQLVLTLGEKNAGRRRR